VPEVRPLVCRPDLQHAWHLYVIRLNLERLRINRNEFIQALHDEKIGTSVHFIPLHLHPYYRNTFGYDRGDFPNATALYEEIISLPIYPDMTDTDIESVIEAVRNIAVRTRK
jgi:dTDP-4-amino-4,6-dideoxygalactose transaminase